MADTLDIVTLEEAYRAINDPTSASSVAGGDAGSHDDQMARWITGVSRRLDDLCGPVVRRTITGELHDGGRHDIWPRERPVAEVTEVVEYDNTTSTTLTAETNASKPDDGYLLDDRGGRYQVILRRSGNADATFHPGRRNIEITYEAGRYADTASVDAKFKMAIAGILRRLWARDAGAWATGADPFDQGSQAFFDAFKQSTREFLADEIRAPAVG